MDTQAENGQREEKQYQSCLNCSAVLVFVFVYCTGGVSGAQMSAGHGDEFVYVGGMTAPGCRENICPWLECLPWSSHSQRQSDHQWLEHS